MLKTAQLVLVIAVAATGLVALARASSPTILTIKDVHEASDGETTDASEGDAVVVPQQQGLFANNKIQIQDSQIFLTDSDRKQLIRSIARAMVADHAKAKATNATDTVESPLLSLNRDAFLFLKDDGIVRLGWRYPLATWKIYKTYMAPASCEVNRVVGDYFYC